MSKFIDRTGEKNTNNYGEEMEIIKYGGYDDIVIKFTNNGYTMHTSYNSFKNGRSFSPYAKRVYGHGYVGIGKYKPSIVGKIYNSGHNVMSRIYDVWNGMLERCYDPKYQQNKPTYKGCYVCDEWLNYQNFAEWYENNYYETNDGEVMRLDKDILIKGNKCYSPQTCCFVPNNINVMFTSCKSVRGDLPIGVTYVKQGKKHYRVRVSDYIISNKRLDFGVYMTSQEAFEIYKLNKEKIIKQVADKYKDQIPQKVYDALYNYEVEITD